MIHGGMAGENTQRVRRARVRGLELLQDMIRLEDDRDELEELQVIGHGPPIIFSPVDEIGVQHPYIDALMIIAVVTNFDVAHIFIDIGSSVDVIYYDCLRRFNIGFEIKLVDTTIIGFTGAALAPLGQVSLPVSMGDYPAITTGSVYFLVIDAPSVYNVILGRPSLNRFQAVVSMFHIKIKFPVNELIGEVRGEQLGARRSYVEALRYRPRIDQVNLQEDWQVQCPRDDVLGREDLVEPDMKEAQHVLSTEELLTVELDLERMGKTTRIGSQLDEEQSRRMIGFLRDNADVFAWGPADLTGINPTIATHRLNIMPDAKPIKQKRRHFGQAKDEIMEK